MGQTLTHGVYLPDEGERNCYAGLAANWQILDSSVGTIAAHTSALSAKAPLVHTHTKSGVTDLLNSNFIPSANNSYNLGSSSYQWNNLYAKNYYYNGTAWGLDKANKWSEDQYIVSSSNKYFIIQNTSWNAGEAAPSSNKTLGGIWFRDYNGINISYQQVEYSSNGDIYSRWLVRSKFTNDAPSTSGTIINSVIDLGLTSSGKRFVRPGINDTDLGTSTNKWKTLNGVNPGALSLPGAFENINNQIKNPSDQLNAINLNGGSNTWVSDVDCYLYFYIPNNKFTWVKIFWPASLVRCGQTFVPVPDESSDYSGFLPVPANTTVVIQIKGTQAPIFRRSACLGNV